MLFRSVEKDNDSKLASFLRIIKPYYPMHNRDDLQITSFSIEKDANKDIPQVLHIEVESTKNPKIVKAFIENISQEFRAPLIRVEGKKAFIRFKAIDANKDYIGKSFDMLIAINDDVILQESIIAEQGSFFVAKVNKLNFKLLWFAFLGGIILNLMPCVFPVLSLKILSFTRFG